MSSNNVRQKYFISRDLRFSIALIILWALLVTAVFTYFATALGDRIGHGILFLTIVMAGYVVIIVVLTMLFSHRLIGPFQRLKTEIRLIIAGEYQRRLSVRTSDDLYIRSFISEVNKILSELERMQDYREEVIRHIDSELLALISLIEDSEPCRETLRGKVLSLHRKIKSLENPL